jgi:hypothetical protein
LDFLAVVAALSTGIGAANRFIHILLQSLRDGVHRNALSGSTLRGCGAVIATASKAKPEAIQSCTLRCHRGKRIALIRDLA